MNIEINPDKFGLDSSVVISGRPGGPLDGIRFAAKDVFDVAGRVTGAGNPDWARTHAVAEKHAFAVQKLLDSGATLAGKTVSDELAYSLVGANMHYGTPENPKAPGRVPGGSSSGSASCVAAGLTDIALGTDTSGSVRIPAAYCGLFGIRPTWGSIPTQGVVPLAPSFDTVGWFARSGTILSMVAAALLPEPECVPVERIYLARDAFDLASEDVLIALEPLLSRLFQRFASVHTSILASPGLASWARTYRFLQSAEVWKTHGNWFEQTSPNMASDIYHRLAMGRDVPADELTAACRHREAIRRLMNELVTPGSVVCLPTAPTIAPLRVSRATDLDDLRQRTLCLTCIAGLSGFPQVTIPATTSSGCPAGLSIIGAPGSESFLLQLAAAFDGQE